MEERKTNSAATGYKCKIPATMEPVPVERHPRLLICTKFQMRGALFIALLVLSGAGETNKASAQQSRITQRIDSAQRFTLSGHMHPKATPANDRGRVAPSLELSYVTLTLTQTDAQKADLDNLLAQQQDPASPNYHHWLTPAQYADRFGVSAADLSTITQWLRGQGLTIAGVAQGRNWIAVSGSAAQIEAAFSTEIHEYQVDGQAHFRQRDGTVSCLLPSAVS